MNKEIETLCRTLKSKDSPSFPGQQIYWSSIRNGMIRAMGEELVCTRAILGDSDFAALISHFIESNHLDWDFTENLKTFTNWLTLRPEFSELPFLPALARLESMLYQLQTSRLSGPQATKKYVDAFGEVSLWQAIWPLCHTQSNEDSIQKLLTDFEPVSIESTFLISLEKDGYKIRQE